MASKWVPNRAAQQAFVTGQASLWVARTARGVEEGAKRLAPVRKPNENGRSGGRLRASIGTKMTVKNTGVTARIGSKLNYAEPAHQGANFHIIRPRRKKFLSFKWNKAAQYGIPLTRRGKVQLTKVRHPGMDGVRYLTTPLLVVGKLEGFRVSVVRGLL